MTTCCSLYRGNRRRSEKDNEVRNRERSKGCFKKRWQGTDIIVYNGGLKIEQNSYIKIFNDSGYVFALPGITESATKI